MQVQLDDVFEEESNLRQEKIILEDHVEVINDMFIHLWSYIKEEDSDIGKLAPDSCFMEIINKLQQAVHEIKKKK